MSDVRRMQVGQVVDFVMEYNERHKEQKKEEEQKKAVTHYRLATPEETSAFTRS